MPILNINCPAVLVKSIRDKIQHLNSKMFNYCNQIKTPKFTQLLGARANTNSSFTLGNQNTVVTIPENMPLSDPEKSVLSLYFVAISKKLTNSQLNKMSKKFPHRVELKAFFHDHADNSETSENDDFETLNVRKSKWSPPVGQFASLEVFAKKKMPT